MLKIKVDLQCQVYCDFEHVGEAFPDSMFKMELRKGTYILDFKINGAIVISQDCIIKDDNEDVLLRINLSEVLSRNKIEQKYLEIASTNASIECKNGDYWIVNNDSGVKERLLYNFEDRQYNSLCRKLYFDEAGLLTVNIGGEMVDNWAYYSIKGGKWGCINKNGEIQIPFIYDSSIYFYNEHVTTAYRNGKEIIINKFGEQVFNDIYDSLKGYFLQNQIVCKSGKYGVADVNGKYVIPLIYDDITRIGFDDNQFIAKICKKSGIIDGNNSVIIPFAYDEIHRMEGNKSLFVVRNNAKYGIVDYSNHQVLPCIYDKIVFNKYAICVNYNNKWGVFNYNLDTIVPTEYEICETPKNSFPIIVRKNSYYGMLNIDISSPDKVSRWNGELKAIKEIITCKFDSIYTKHGTETDSYDYDSCFVIKDNGILNCYHYAIRREDQTDKSNDYIAECIIRFSCESFRLIYGNSKKYYVFENNGISTITDGSININVLCKKEDVKNIIALSDGCKYVVSINKRIMIFNNSSLISNIDNAELCYKRYTEVIYGVKQNKKYAIFTQDMQQCTDFIYDKIDANDDFDTIEVMMRVHDRCLYGEYSYQTNDLVSFGYLRSRNLRSNYNWAEKYNVSTGKEGIISFCPKTIVIPFKYNYVRFYTGEKSTVLVVSKDFANPPYKRYALMNTNQELLTEFIFKSVNLRGWADLRDIECCLLHDDIYANFDLSLNDINVFTPFLGFGRTRQTLWSRPCRC